MLAWGRAGIYLADIWGMLIWRGQVLIKGFSVYVQLWFPWHADLPLTTWIVCAVLLLLNCHENKISSQCCKLNLNRIKSNSCSCPLGTPEIGGLTSIQGIEILRGCRGLNVVGGDMVEVREHLTNKRWLLKNPDFKNHLGEQKLMWKIKVKFI